MKFYELSEQQRELLKSLIDESPYSQQKLCLMIGVSKASFSRILNGTQRCKWGEETWRLLAGKLGYTVEGLLEVLHLRAKENTPTISLSNSLDYEAVPIPLIAFDKEAPDKDWCQIKSERTLVMPRWLLPKPNAEYGVYWIPDRGLAPFIQMNDDIIVEIGDRKIVDGAIYLLASDNMIVRRARTPHNGYVKFYSDNSIIYPDVDVPLEDPSIIGRVIAMFRKL